MPTYSLNNNNSGGSFWIGRDDADKLRAAGWYTPPRSEDRWVPIGDPDNYFGSGCTYEELHDFRVEKGTMREAIEEFEEITGQNFFAQGCNCCGCPFTMYELTEDGERNYNGEYMSGDAVAHVSQRPW